MKLSDLAQGRDNNFNLIRIIAAFAVLVNHSFALAIGTVNAQPTLFNITLGRVALDALFITSGFLVTASLLKRQDTIEFVVARILRLYPALLVMQVLVVFGLGFFFTTAGRASYLTSAHTFLFWIKGSTLVAGVDQTLPGVFQNNPLKNYVNGSLWTMPYETGLYGILLGLWLVLGIVPGGRLRALKVTVVGCAAVAALLYIFSYLYMTGESIVLRFFVSYFSGAAFYVLKDRIVLSRRVFWSMIVGAVTLSFFGERVFFVAYVLVLPYVLLYIAYVPSGLVRIYNQVGDYSYGVYIYTWPVQQSIAALVPGVSVLAMGLFSAGITIMLAALSWHLIERRALQLKGRTAAYARSFYPAHI